jgi:cytidine deaminase
MSTVKNISFSYLEYDQPEELDSKDLELVEAAKEAAPKAYAPYSGFHVGAAVRLESGRIVCGSNVENASFPSGICAERTALSGSISNFPDDKPVAIAIAALNGNDFTITPVSPCGNCRQVIAEEELRTDKRIRILLYGKDKIQVIESISHLLPFQFSNKILKACLP